MGERKLQGQTALVTGATSGIGLAVARALAQAGAAVAVNYRGKADRARSIVQEIRSAKGSAVAVEADVAKPDEIEAMFTAVDRELGRLDILVANAGIQRDAPFIDLSLDDWRQVLDVNLGGQFLCMQQAIRRFLKQPRSDRSRARGKIVCMSSVHELIPWAGHVNYAAAKGGVMQLMKSAAQEFACHGVRINGIAPGAIKTSINEEAWSSAGPAEALLELIPYGRIGDPEDVARAAVWLVSDDADYVTGTTLFVDGGMSLFPSFRDNG
ncbi:MAG: 3-oxoacyl-ACP reductase FabG [Burkholderiaceae bacterium]